VIAAARLATLVLPLLVPLGLSAQAQEVEVGTSHMLRILILAVALPIDPAITAGAEMSGCSQLPDLSAARLRWTAVRKSRVDPGHSQESCRSYGSNFFEAVTTRQAASFCRDGVDRQQALELLDAEIEAFNGLIATQCSG
jgi:hypothetical protein